MTSPLTQAALDKLPADVRDHIKVEAETGYSITLAMTIGDLERLVGHFATLDDLRRALEEVESELDAARALRYEEGLTRQEAVGKLRQMRDPLFKGTPPTLEEIDAVLAVLDS